MIGAVESLAALLILAGAFFFLGGTAGLLRFPDALCRLHALTKADNLGLGLVIVGLMLLDGTFGGVVKLLLIWLLALVASSSACYLIGRSATVDDVGAVERGDGGACS